MDSFVSTCLDTKMDWKTQCLILITITLGFGAGIITTMLFTFAAHHYLSPDPELSGHIQATCQCTREVMSFVAGIGIITTTILALVYFSTDPELSGQVQATCQCTPKAAFISFMARIIIIIIVLALCNQCNQRDSVKNSSDPDPKLHFHLERSGSGLRTDKTYPRLTNEFRISGPYRVITNKGKIVVSERQGHFISVRDLNGTVIRKYGSHGEGRGKMMSPAGIALDDKEFMYVTSEHKLQKFSSDGSVIAEIGGSKPGNNPGKAFNKPYTVAIRNGKVYVCDAENDRIQVFDLELHFLECIATDVKKPQDIAFDNEGKMYVTSKSDNCVYVFDESGNKVHRFGQQNRDGIGLSEPTGIHIYGNLALVSDEGVNSIMVYNITGQFITSLVVVGGFSHPRGITSDDKGQIYICDYRQNRIVVL